MLKTLISWFKLQRLKGELKHINEAIDECKFQCSLTKVPASTKAEYGVYLMRLSAERIKLIKEIGLLR